jgi:hypothetical protein
VETLSQLLKQEPWNLVTVGQDKNHEDHVTLVTSNIGIVWNGLNPQFAIDAGIYQPDYQRPYGYIYRSTNGWTCRIWADRWKNCFDDSTNGEFERYAKFIPPSIILVAIEDIDDVVHTLLRSGHKQVSGICVDTVVRSG